MPSTAAQVAFDSGWTLHSAHSSSEKRELAPRRELAPWGENTALGMLSAEALRELELIGSPAEYEAGHILFLEQERLKQVFVVLSGEVRLSLQNFAGKRLTVSIAKPGSILGMHSALFDSPSEWSACALYRSQIASIRHGDFLTFVQRHPEAYRVAMVELVRNLNYACGTLRLVGLSCSVRKRLASQLLAWGEQGRKKGDQTQFSLPLTHAEIAEFTGAVRETVTRALLAFRRRGLVEIRGSVLTIPSTEALRRYADLG